MDPWREIHVGPELQRSTWVHNGSLELAITGRGNAIDIWEYRKYALGSLLGEIISRMINKVKCIQSTHRSCKYKHINTWKYYVYSAVSVDKRIRGGAWRMMFVYFSMT